MEWIPCSNDLWVTNYGSIDLYGQIHCEMLQQIEIIISRQVELVTTQV
jgi:hypothetical protein